MIDPNKLYKVVSYSGNPEDDGIVARRRLTLSEAEELLDKCQVENPEYHWEIKEDAK